MVVGDDQDDAPAQAAESAHEPPNAHRQKQIIGKGGVALVCYHLARCGHDFILTTENSASGDIWADVKGTRVAVEVKTSMKRAAWRIGLKQVKAVDFCVFVALLSASCFVLTSAEAQELIKKRTEVHPGLVVLRDNMFPFDALNGWRRLDGVQVARGFRIEMRRKIGPAYTAEPGKLGRPTKTGLNTVSRTRADGSVTYFYYHRRTSRRIGSSDEGWTRESAIQRAREIDDGF